MKIGIRSVFVVSFVLTALLQSASAEGQTEARASWGDIIDSAQNTFGPQIAAFLTKLDAHDFASAYEAADRSFASQVDGQQFEDSIKRQLPLPRNHRLVSQELVVTANVLKPASVHEGKFYMSAIISFDAGGRTFYSTMLWQWEGESGKWFFKNFPFGYSALPYYLRIAGTEKGSDDDVPARSVRD